MSTAVETAFVPNYKQPPEVLPIYGCSSKCELWPGICWREGIQRRIAANPLIKCQDCKTGKPHVHKGTLYPIERIKKPTVFSGHMGEIADLHEGDIYDIRITANRSPQHLFQIFTHQPDFWRKYPKWPGNVWCCQSITKGEIVRPPGLECGKFVAYCEPVLGYMGIAGVVHVSREGQARHVVGGYGYDVTHPDWLVIGLLNHADYAKLGITLEQLAIWIKMLMHDARALGIPVFLKGKNDARWAQMGIKPEQSWP